MVIDILYAIGLMTTWLVLGAWVHPILNRGCGVHYPPHQCDITSSTASMTYIDAVTMCIAHKYLCTVIKK